LLPLACSVRGCTLPLERRERAFICPNGHTYDVARSGYVNLLQPQDRRSTAPGDSRAAVEARAALFQAGVGRAVVDAVIARVESVEPGADLVVVDLGSGSGDALGMIAATRPVTGIGIDLSTAAAGHAARRFPSLTWVVANADRRLPLLDRSVNVVISLHGRRNPAECARVLTGTGLLIVVLPAPDDLIELRSLVQGEGVERDRADAMLAAHEGPFAVVDRSPVRETHDLDRDSLLHLLRSTYRGARLAAAEQVQSLDRMSVTLRSECVVLQRKEGHEGRSI
jgi:23S rRNA (guanine745-N1)-methyltransferase